MTEINPPLYLDQDNAYGAAELGLPYRDIMGEGIVESGDLAVTANTGLKSSVAAGAAWIRGDDDANAQPTYRMRNDAAVLLQHDAADATNPRIDLVIAEVLDSTFSGVSKLWRLRAVKGTPASSPSAPALPNNAIPLAQVTIPAGSGTLGTITDKRKRASVGGGVAVLSGKSFSATKSANQTGLSAGWAKITFDTAVWDDSAGALDLGTHAGRLTPAQGEKWRLSCGQGSGGLYTVADGNRFGIAIYKNGSAYAYLEFSKVGGSDDSVNAAGTCLVEGNGSDYFEVYGHYGGGTWSVAADAAASYFHGERIA